MAEKQNHYRLGVFVLVTVCLVAAIMFVLGGRSLFQPTFTFETYFSSSVTGLEIGAPVNFRGVKLGTVSEIVTSAAAYEREEGVPPEKRKGYIVVRAKLQLTTEQGKQMADEAAQLVKIGIRAQTQLAGITGQQFLSLDFLDPATHPATALSFDWKPKYFYVPSAPSLTGEIVANVQGFLANLNKADIQKLAHNLNTLIVDVNKKVNDLPVGELATDARSVLTDADATIKRLDQLLADPGLKRSVDNVAAFTGDLRRLSGNGKLDRMVKSLNDLAGRLDGMVGDNQYDVRVIIQDLRVTADNLRAVSESIKRYPAGALIGGPPDRIQVPGSTK